VHSASASCTLRNFDTTAAEPTVKYTVVTIDGERVHDVTVKRSELRGQ
jgi:hypothetical protein